MKSLFLFFMNVSVKDCLIYLDQQGWSELIDPRWEQDVIKELKTRFPNLKDEVLKETLDVVIY